MNAATARSASTPPVRRDPPHLRAVDETGPERLPDADHDFETWLAYEDEQESIREEAEVHLKRLEQLRSRWQQIEAIQGELTVNERRTP